MSGDRLAPWRKTGRKADARHFDGLCTGCLFEFAVYDDRHRQQGRAIACLTGPALETNIDGGRMFEGQILAIEDEYYEYWVENLFGRIQDSPVIFFHFCEVSEASCRSRTAFRDPIHVDVFRLIGAEQMGRLTWLKEEQKEWMKSHPAVIGGRDVPGSGGPPAPGAAPPPEAAPGAVETGVAGLEGLAKALGAGQEANKRPLNEESSDADERRRQKKKDRRDRRGHKRSPSPGREGRSAKAPRRDGRDQDQGQLQMELNKKVPQEPRLSALELGPAHKKKKKKKSRSSSSNRARGRSPSSSSSSGSLFRSAALPRGMERLRRLHQKRPGSLASLSLLRMQELVHRAQGRGTAAESDEKLPPVALGYLAGVFLVQNPPVTVGLRTLRELRTVATVIDMLCQNDALRALDVLVQRLKALELAHAQQGWSQASQLELVLEDNQSAVFRPELKAAQTEVKEDWKIQRGPFRQPRSSGWNPNWAPVNETPGAPADGDTKDTPPNNQPKGGARKGKGKGKKGRFGRK